jgi:Papain family cysteine protease
MKRNLLAHALLTACILLPGGLAACKHHSSGSGGSGGAAPATSGSGASPTADNTDDSGGGGGGGGGGSNPHEKKDKKEHADKESDGGGGGKDEPMPKFVINKVTPEPLEPPALRRAPKTPSLPSFPEKNKYPKEAEVPKGGDAEGCGQVWTGNEYIPVECVDPDVHSKHHRAAKVVVPYDKMKQPADKLPKMVDHRVDETEGPIRKQGGPQCTAFAFTAGLDHSVSRWLGKPGEFSVMQVWGRYRKLQERAATDANVGDFIANESDWPYDAKVANSWLKCGHGAKEPCGKAVDEAKMKELDETHRRIAEVTKIEIIPATKIEVIREKIAAGQDVIVGLKLPNFTTAGEKGAKYIVGSQKGSAKMGHEVLLSGYAETPHGTYFLLHNSWGTAWGDEGYAWLHEDLLKAFWLDNRIDVPDVEPTEIAEIRRHARSPHDKCEKEKLPDSITGECAGKCPDGGPRHNNICPDGKKKECPEGHINLTGTCVLSAPKASGSEGKVKWECAQTGCTYEFPKGEFECKDKECQVSCPAPDFRLASMKKGLVCVE